MVRALDIFSVEVAAVERHAAVRTSVAQGEGMADPIASHNQRNFKQGGFVELIAVDAVGRQSPIPEAGEHERIGRLALRRVEVGHGVVQR